MVQRSISRVVATAKYPTGTEESREAIFYVSPGNVFPVYLHHGNGTVTFHHAKLDGVGIADGKRLVCLETIVVFHPKGILCPG